MSNGTESEEVVSSPRSPYMPWKTFNTATSAIKAATVPHALDSTARPPSMSGGDWRRYVAAVRFFGLIEGSEGVVTDKFTNLVNAHGTPEWKEQVGHLLVPAFIPIISDVPLDNGTAGQLDNAFRTKGGADNQVLRKCVRFFLHVLSDAGVSYSPRFSMRRESSSGKPRRKKEPKPSDTQPLTESSDTSKGDSGGGIPSTLKGMIRHTLYFRRGNKVIEGAIFVPEDTTTNDCAIIEAQLAVIKLFAVAPMHNN